MLSEVTCAETPEPMSAGHSTPVREISSSRARKTLLWGDSREETSTSAKGHKRSPSQTRLVRCSDGLLVDHSGALISVF